jgi:hypothetical protein
MSKQIYTLNIVTGSDDESEPWKAPLNYEIDDAVRKSIFKQMKSGSEFLIFRSIDNVDRFLQKMYIIKMKISQKLK